jgi:enoyl-CoA hydratase
MGLANRVVAARGRAPGLGGLAHQLAALPQFCLRSDRMSALEQWGLTEEEAAVNEARRGRAVIDSGETLDGRSRFAGGAGVGGGLPHLTLMVRSRDQSTRFAGQ